MPPIYYMNPPPNPFWDFVAGLEDHPMFSGPPSQSHRHRGPSSPRGRFANAPPQPTAAQPEMSETVRGKQPTVEDPPEVDPSTVKPDTKQFEQNSDERGTPFRGRGRFGQALNGENAEPRRGRGEHPCRGGRGRRGWGGPPPFMFGHPFFARPPWAQHGPEGPGHEHRGPPGPPPHHHHGPGGPDHERRGPPGPPPHHRGPSDHPHGPPPHARGPHGGPGAHRRSPPPSGPRPGFDLGEFLNKLGGRLGVDLSEAAEGFGLTTDRFSAGRTGQDVDFEPRADIFENKDRYTIHVSLPGAKKSDIGVDYDGEHSVLRITGVVHRPEVDEQMLNELVVDGRKRETGVFEKAIRLGTKRDPANIDVAGISAKMTDGVLVVKIPKVEKVHQKREVPITADPLTEGKVDYEDEYSEKSVLFDADEQASVAATEHTEVPRKKPVSLVYMQDEEADTQKKQPETVASNYKVIGKDQEANREGAEAEGRPNVQHEQLPAHSPGLDHEEDDWEKFSDASGEGEYVKINVD